MSVSKNAAIPQWKIILGFATVYLVWGSTYFFIQKAIHGFPPMLMGATRFTVAGLLMFAWCLFRKEKLFDANQIKHSAITGLLLLFIGTGLVIWVEQTLPSGLVAIIVSASPLYFLLLDYPKWKENFNSKSTLVGLIFGFCGVILLFFEKVQHAFAGNGMTELGSMALLIIGAACWSGGSIYSKYKSPQGTATVNSTWQMVWAGIAFLLVSLLRGETTGFSFREVPVQAYLSIVYLIIFGSLAGFSAYVWLLQVRPVTQVSTYAYVNPVVAVLLGVFFAGEKITGFQLAGLLVILTGVLLINLSKYRKGKQV